MTFKTANFMVNQMSIQDYEALRQVNEILDQFQKEYSATDVLQSVNDGEVILIEELARVKGILSFIMANRVVEVNPK